MVRFMQHLGVCLAVFIFAACGKVNLKNNIFSEIQDGAAAEGKEWSCDGHFDEVIGDSTYHVLKFEKFITDVDTVVNRLAAEPTLFAGSQVPYSKPVYQIIRPPVMRAIEVRRRDGEETSRMPIPAKHPISVDKTEDALASVCSWWEKRERNVPQ